MRGCALYLLLGTAFGLVLSRSGAADYDVVQGMFLLESFQLWGIMLVALLVTAPGLQVLKRHGRSVSGAPLPPEAEAAPPGHAFNGCYRS